VWATKNAAREEWLSGLRVEIAASDEIAERSGSDAHQGICADVEAYHYAGASELLAPPDAFVVVLDEVTDPQNLGAIARTAEAVGVTGIVIPERRSAEVTPAVCRASAGAVEHLPVGVVPNLARYLGEIKRDDLWAYAAAADAQTTLWETDLTAGSAVVFGAEGKGVRPLVRRTCDATLAIPLGEGVESLNVSVAAAVVLYEARRQRRVLP